MTQRHIDIYSGLPAPQTRDERMRQQVSRAIDLSHNGYRIADICKELDKSPATIHRWFRAVREAQPA